MPDPKPIPGGGFGQYQRQLGKWLRENLSDVRSLSADEIKKYEEKRVVAGWQVRTPGSCRIFYILLNNSFPYSRIQIAYVEGDYYLEWPHVEDESFLCLPNYGWRPCEDLESSAAERLRQAQNLVANCQSLDYLQSESKREFLTYWGRQKKSYEALSIIDTKNSKSRKIAARTYKGRYIVAESEDQLYAWLKNAGISEVGRSEQAIFAFIDDAPVLPLPNSARQFVRRLLNYVPDLRQIITTLSPLKKTLVVLAVESDQGVALFGGELGASPKRGFRSRPATNILKFVWSSAALYRPIRVNRADSFWIHGRDQDGEGHRILSACRVVIIGAGSLGSQVATRLAEAGVGHICISDPERLEPCNVGRHALGMESVHANKASSLASVLCAQYPHANFEGFNSRWQDILRDSPDIFHRADIVVSSVGEIEQDLSWDSWHQSGALGQIPTVYGWLGTQGATGHALALKPGGASLSCYFDPDGFLKLPDTVFRGGDQMRPEPACGTEFQPYGPLSAGQTALLVARTVINILIGREVAPLHRIYACSTGDLTELGGEWTDRHKANRPERYEGPFEYSPTVDCCHNCHNCK